MWTCPVLTTVSALLLLATTSSARAQSSSVDTALETSAQTGRPILAVAGAEG